LGHEVLGQVRVVREGLVRVVPPQAFGKYKGMWEMPDFYGEKDTMTEIITPPTLDDKLDVLEIISKREGKIDSDTLLRNFLNVKYGCLLDEDFDSMDKDSDGFRNYKLGKMKLEKIKEELKETKEILVENDNISLTKKGIKALKTRKSIEAYETPKEKKEAIINTIIKIGFDICKKLIIDQYNQTYAIITGEDDDCLKIIPIDSFSFRDMLSAEMFKQFQMGVYSEALRSAISTLRGKSLAESERKNFYERVAMLYDGNKLNKIIYDMTRDDWKYVEITEEGWKIINESPVFFHRFDDIQKAQCLPVKHDKKLGYYLDEFVEKLTNIKTSEENPIDNRLLFKVWLCVGFLSDIPREMLLPYGSPGSAKSTLTRNIKDIIDPCRVEEKPLPDNPDNMAISLYKNFCASYDNVSSINEWQSDMLARSITGGGIEKRKLFTDMGSISMLFKRLVILNGINIPVWKPDLYDRAFPLELEKIEKVKKLSQLNKEFEEIKPFILSDIFDILSKAMKIYPEIDLEYPRMADYSAWGEAISRAMGNENNVFFDEYLAKIRRASIEFAKGSTIAEAIAQFCNDIVFHEERIKPGKIEHKTEGKRWAGSPTELLGELTRVMKEDNRLYELEDSKVWPKTPTILSRKINELVPMLLNIGLRIKHERSGDERSWAITLTDRFVAEERAEPDPYKGAKEGRG
jgi:hypothetical protein